MDTQEKRYAGYFRYLDALRESGATNMFGASPYLTRDMGVKKDKAGAIVGAWMKTFSNDKSPEDRAKEYLAIKESQ